MNGVGVVGWNLHVANTEGKTMVSYAQLSFRLPLTNKKYMSYKDSKWIHKSSVFSWYTDFLHFPHLEVIVCCSIWHRQLEMNLEWSHEAVQNQENEGEFYGNTVSQWWKTTVGTNQSQKFALSPWSIHEKYIFPSTLWLLLQESAYLRSLLTSCKEHFWTVNSESLP